MSDANVCYNLQPLSYYVYLIHILVYLRSHEMADPNYRADLYGAMMISSVILCHQMT
jgi:hypothetical protein